MGINLKRLPLKNFKEYGKNDHEIIINLLSQYLKTNKNNEQQSNSHLILNIDHMQENLPYEIMFYENIIENFNEIKILINSAIVSWCGKERMFYLSTSEKTALEFTSASNINHLNDHKLHRIQGYIDSISEFKRIPKYFVFECPSCGRVFNYKKEKPVPKCRNAGCSGYNKQRLSLDYIQYVSRKYFVVNSSTTPSNQVLLKCYFEIDDKTNPSCFIFDDYLIGKKVDLLLLPSTYESTMMKERTQEYVYKLKGIKTYQSILLTSKDKLKVKTRIKKDYEEMGVKVFEELCYGMTKKVFGHEFLRQAIFCTVVGLAKKDPDFKGDINQAFNIMLLGDPSVGKTFSAKQFIPYFENSAYIQGISTTTVGLLGGCDKVPDMGFIIRTGQLVKSDNSFILLDEVDKMAHEQHKGLFTALSEGQHSITNVKGSFNFEYNTGFIMVANPKGGRFDSFSTVRSQIDLDPAFLSRVDIATIVNKPYEDDNGIINHDRYNEYLEYRTKDRFYKSIYDDNFLRQYAVVVKEYENPKLTKDIKQYIREYFKHVYLKQHEKLSNKSMGFSNTEDLVVKSIDERYMNTIMKLSKIIARACLCKVVDKSHFDKACEILEETMLNEMKKAFGTDDLTSVEYSLTEKNKTKIPITKQQKLDWTLRQIKNVDTQDGLEFVKLLEKSEDVGIDEIETDKLISYLLQKGEILEFKRGYFKSL